MKTKEVKYLLQQFFDGESTEEEEKQLELYFGGDSIDEEVAHYAEFFGGLSDLAQPANDTGIEEDVMNHILENEHQEKTKYRSMWKTVTGIAASIIIVLGGFLFYQEQQKPFDDTFEDPDEAYAYAVETLRYVSGKYNKGIAELSNFEKLQSGQKSVKKGTAPIIEFYEGIEKLKKTKEQPKTVKTDSI